MQRHNKKRQKPKKKKISFIQFSFSILISIFISIFPLSYCAIVLVQCVRNVQMLGCANKSLLFMLLKMIIYVNVLVRLCIVACCRISLHCVRITDSAQFTNSMVYGSVCSRQKRLSNLSRLKEIIFVNICIHKLNCSTVNASANANVGEKHIPFNIKFKFLISPLTTSKPRRSVQTNGSTIKWNGSLPIRQTGKKP